jgi:superfamily II DNA or RNA helicase
MRKVTLKSMAHWTFVDSKFDPTIDDILDREFRYHPSGFVHSPRFKDGKWDGFKHLYSMKMRAFPSGLIDRAKNALEGAGYAVALTDKRAAPAVQLPDSIELNGISLRGRQLEAIDAAINGVRGVIKASTGFGKTEVFAGLTYALGLPTIIFVHKKDLLHQTAKRLILRLGADAPIGIIGDGIFNPQLITVATFQTMGNLLKDPLSKKETVAFLKGFDVLILDEAHHASSAVTYGKVVRSVPAYYRFGFSATPFKEPKGSEMHLIGMTGELLYDYSLAEAINEGISVQPYCFMIDYEQQDFDDDLDYASLYELGIVDNPLRTEVIVEAGKDAEKAGLPTVVIVERLEHGRRIAQALKWQFVSGEHTAEHREYVRDQVNAGKVPGFVSTVMDEGVDVPNLACVILASGGKAPHRLIQRIGRGTRKGTHDFCVVVDFYDAGSDTLEAQTKKRLRTYKELGFDVEMVERLPNLTQLEKAA